MKNRYSYCVDTSKFQCHVSKFCRLCHIKKEEGEKILHVILFMVCIFFLSGHQNVIQNDISL